MRTKKNASIRFMKRVKSCHIEITKLELATQLNVDVTNFLSDVLVKIFWGRKKKIKITILLIQSEVGTISSRTAYDVKGLCDILVQ